MNRKPPAVYLLSLTFVIPLFFALYFVDYHTKSIQPLGSLDSSLKSDNNKSNILSLEKASEERKHSTGVPNLVAGHKITDDLPSNYVRDGSVDYTLYIQNALDKYNDLVFPAFPLLINDRGLNISSNKTISFLPGSILLLKPSIKKSYNILNLRGASNVIIYNPVIKGDRYSHLGTVGEYGMGISIRGGKNINIYNPRITECWGDGIYIGQDRGKVPEDVVIKGAYLKNNRRDGISIIAVNGLILENIYAGYTDGTKPMCGINFETNNPDCEIKNVKVINAKTEHNKGSGIQIGLSNLLGGGSKKVDILIINHVDISSKSFAVKIAGNRKDGIVGGDLSGVVNFVNPSWNSTASGIPMLFSTNLPNFHVKVSSPKVKQSNGNVLSSTQTHAVLKKYGKRNFKFVK